MHNTQKKYGYVSIVFHWLTAFTIFGLFGLGYYMVDLDYYHTWYTTAPNLHKSFGMLLFVIIIIRLVWRFTQITPEHITSHSQFERKAGKLTHQLLFMLIFIIIITGYLISTADGRGIEVFGLFEVPSLGAFIENQEDIAGTIHEWLAYALILLATLHGLAAIKHHVIDKDNTLNRMIGKRNAH